MKGGSLVVRLKLAAAWLRSHTNWKLELSVFTSVLILFLHLFIFMQCCIIKLRLLLLLPLVCYHSFKFMKTMACMDTLKYKIYNTQQIRTRNNSPIPFFSAIVNLYSFLLCCFLDLSKRWKLNFWCFFTLKIDNQKLWLSLNSTCLDSLHSLLPSSLFIHQSHCVSVTLCSSPSSCIYRHTKPLQLSHLQQNNNHKCKLFW